MTRPLVEKVLFKTVQRSTPDGRKVEGYRLRLWAKVALLAAFVAKRIIP